MPNSQTTTDTYSAGMASYLRLSSPSRGTDSQPASGGDAPPPPSAARAGCGRCGRFGVRRQASWGSLAWVQAAARARLVPGRAPVEASCVQAPAPDRVQGASAAARASAPALAPATPWSSPPRLAPGGSRASAPGSPSSLWVMLSSWGLERRSFGEEEGMTRGWDGCSMMQRRRLGGSKAVGTEPPNNRAHGQPPGPRPPSPTAAAAPAPSRGT